MQPTPLELSFIAGGDEVEEVHSVVLGSWNREGIDVDIRMGGRPVILKPIRP